MAFPNDPVSPVDMSCSEFFRAALKYLRLIALGSVTVSPSSVAGNTAAPLVVAIPPYSTTDNTGVNLTTTGQEITIPSNALHCYISNTSATEKIFIRYGAGATNSNYTRFVAPGGEIQIYDFKGTISIAGTSISGQAAVIVP